MIGSQWRAFRQSLRSYFSAYGGWPAVISSPLFHVAVAITVMNYPSWKEPGWADKTQSLIPNLLGFSLGTYALLFSLISNRLKESLRAVPNKSGVPWLDAINATFFHFIFVQVLALTWSFLPSFYIPVWFLALLKYGYKDDFLNLTSWLSLFVSFTGHLLLVYSVLLTIGSALAVYRLARIKDPSTDS